MATYAEGRECRICGAIIGDDNPDGIGGTCRKVWNRAHYQMINHFFGLEKWKVLTTFWVEQFEAIFTETKFRSSFHRDFYTSIKEKNQEGSLRVSRKMLEIMQIRLLDKLGHQKYQGLLNEERVLLQKFYNSLTFTSEHQKYRLNIAKSLYGESSKNENAK